MEISNHTLEVKINNAFLRDNEIKTIIGSKELLDNSIGALKRFKFDETLEWMLKTKQINPFAINLWAIILCNFN